MDAGMSSFLHSFFLRVGAVWKEEMGVWCVWCGWCVGVLVCWCVGVLVDLQAAGLMSL